MSKASTQPARGMRDFLPGDVRRRRFVIQTIASVYERYGFEPLETPAVENLETLLGKYGEEGNQLVFRILKRGAELQRALDKPAGEAGAGRAARVRRPGAPLRPDRAAGARRRRAPDAAEVLQALPDSAGVARRSAGARPVPRVLSVRRGRARIDVAGRGGGAVRRGGRGAAGARVHRLHDPAESPAAPDRAARSRRRAGRQALGCPDRPRQAREDHAGRGDRRHGSARHRAARRGCRDRAVPDRLPGRRRAVADQRRRVRGAAHESR